MRRTQKEIPSLLLWQQVIADQRVNSPFQRFKRNILLWLQLALLALLAIAAAQPFIRGRDTLSKNLPILIDCSAIWGRSTRRRRRPGWSLAKEQIRPIIDDMLPDQRLMLIESTTRPAADSAHQQQDRAAAGPGPDRGGRRPVAAGRCAGPGAGQSKLVEIPAIRLYSDGNVPTRPNPVSGELQAIVDFDLPFQVDYYRIKTEGGNIGITSMNATRPNAESWEVFVRVEASSAAAGNGQLRLSKMVDGKPVIIGEERVVLNPARVAAAGLLARLRDRAAIEGRAVSE